MQKLITYYIEHYNKHGTKQFNLTETEETDNPHRVRSRIRLGIPLESSRDVQRGLPTRFDPTTLCCVQATRNNPSSLPDGLHGVELCRLSDRPATK